MQWESILLLRTWSSLSAIEHPVIERKNGVLEIGINAYVITQPYDRDFELNKPGAPFVTRAFWAESLAAMEHLMLGEPAPEFSGPRGTPPEILLLRTNGTFDAIRAAGKHQQNYVSERGLYSNQGLFLHRAVDIGRFTYCFYGRTDVADDRPFAVEVSLVG